MSIKEVFNFEAEVKNLDQINAFLEEVLEKENVPFKTILNLEIPLEELFVNICHYAYAPETGDVQVLIEITDDLIKIILEDSGKPFNPLEKEDPDITLPAEERPIGGLGILLSKNILNKLDYKYQDGKNISILIMNRD